MLDFGLECVVMSENFGLDGTAGRELFSIRMLLMFSLLNDLFQLNIMQQNR